MYIECDEDNVVREVLEDSTCVYEIKMGSPAGCDEEEGRRAREEEGWGLEL